jgi:hypothetical protein
MVRRLPGRIRPPIAAPLRKGGCELERLALLEPGRTRHSELLGKQAKIVFITLAQLVSHPKTSLKLSA